uniref:Uncharacterized protein n=1 Tax=Xenopus tropicalis TaxID=8364 RepID=A0A803K1J7_XENTR
FCYCWCPGRIIDLFQLIFSPEAEYRASPLTDVVFLSIVARGSIAIANSKGERGHPCLVPLESEKGDKIVWFVFIRALGLL